MRTHGSRFTTRRPAGFATTPHHRTFAFDRWPATQAVVRYRTEDGSFEHFEDGRSLAASVEHGSAPDPRPVFAYRRAMNHLPPARRGDTHSVRRDHWKYIRTHDGATELFDLSVDPDEAKTLQTTSTSREGELASVLDQHRAGAQGTTPQAELSDDVPEGLRALGYVD